MSHFVVMVALNGNEGLDEALAPFNEQPGPGSPYLEFTDETENVRAQWAQLDVDGNDRYVEWTKVTDGKKKVERRMYRSLSEFAEQYHGYVVKKTPNGERYGTMGNPQAKWDWYQVGGRWSGSLKLKGSDQWGDGALKEEVDIDGMELPMRKRAEKTWDEFHQKRDSLDGKSYAGLFDGYPGPSDKSPFHKFHVALPEEYRKWCHEQMGFLSGYREVEQLRSMPREDYVMCSSVWSPYAVLWDGKWYAKGEMGWFGISMGDESQWRGAFKQLWSEIPDDHTVVIVDCHI